MSIYTLLYILCFGGDCITLDELSHVLNALRLGPTVSSLSTDIREKNNRDSPTLSSV